jgi:urease accessory protein
MKRAIHVKPKGTWPDAFEIGTVTLGFEDRHRRRIRMVMDQGDEFLLDLANAHHLADGDGLEVEGGGFVRVVAAPEEVADITCARPEDLARIAWHVGNRHFPVQILPGGALRIPADHVMIAMLQGLGAKVARKNAPFQPEPGAYHTHDHD